MTDAANRTPTSTVDALRAEVDASLRALALPTHPQALYAPIRYVLERGGKRLRPVLVLLAGEIYGAARSAAMPVALAVEVFHNFTLVHDDIMDHSATRRGQPTVHVKWDESTAILSGDYMMALSYRLLAQGPEDVLSEMLAVFDEMVGHLCEGQALDKQFESVPVISLSDYEQMIDSKTGALLRASLELGGLTAMAPEVDRVKLREIGVHLGRAFQIQDDLLDLVADDHRWGKTVGGDLVEGKKTYLLVRALELASGDERAFFERLVLNGGLEHEEVPRARGFLTEMGIVSEARDAVNAHTEAALTLIQSIESSAAPRATLANLVEQLRVRMH